MHDHEDVEGIGEREDSGVVGWEREELLEGSPVLGRNGVGETVEVVVDSPVGLSHAQVRHFSAQTPLSVSRHLYFLFAWLCESEGSNDVVNKKEREMRENDKSFYV